VKHRSGLQQLFEAFPPENPFHGPGVGLTPGETEPGENPSGRLETHHVGEVLAELGEGVGIVHHDPPAAETQGAVVEGDELLELEVVCSQGFTSSIESVDFIMKRIASIDHTEFSPRRCIATF
jgi:hypothetical protein